MPSPAPTLIFSQQSADEHIRVWQQDELRWLDFDDGLLQSEILLGKPELIPQVMNRAMLAGCMFNEPPKRVLLVGTGGGATARYFAHRFPDVVGEAIEISPTVSDIAKEYFDFPSDNWTLITADILDYVKDCKQKYDLIIADIAVDQKTPEWLVSSAFLMHCRTLLTEQGCFSLNLLFDDKDDVLQSLATIRQEYDRRTVCLSLAEHQNIIVLAFNSTPLFLPNAVPSRLAKLEVEWAVEFTRFYKQMLKDNPKNSGVF